jgi:hypothetical protein
MAGQVSELKDLSSTDISVVANWLVCQVTSLKKQVHPGWEYNDIEDPTQETSDNHSAIKMVEQNKRCSKTSIAS